MNPLDTEIDYKRTEISVESINQKELEEKGNDKQITSKVEQDDRHWATNKTVQAAGDGYGYSKDAIQGISENIDNALHENFGKYEDHEHPGNISKECQQQFEENTFHDPFFTE